MIRTLTSLFALMACLGMSVAVSAAPTKATGEFKGTRRGANTIVKTWEIKNGVRVRTETDFDGDLLVGYSRATSSANGKTTYRQTTRITDKRLGVSVTHHSDVVTGQMAPGTRPF